MTGPDLDALLAEAVPPQAQVRLCLRGDLLDAYRRLVARQRAESGSSLAGSGLAEQVDALRAQIEAATIEVTLQAMPLVEWPRLMAEHAPREGEDRDKLLGLNSETFFPALVRRSIVSPEFTAAQFARLLAVISDGEFDRLADSAWSLNRSGQDIPF